MNKPIHPLAADALKFFARVGVKAGAAGFGSVLDDVGGVAEEVFRRTRKARKRLAEIIAFDDSDSEKEIDLASEELDEE